jgi:hypothetical protein
MTKKALVNPLIELYGNQEQTQTGYRIEQIEDMEFDIANPLFWIDVPDDTDALLKYYDPEDQQIKSIWFPPLAELVE